MSKKEMIGLVVGCLLLGVVVSVLAFRGRMGLSQSASAPATSGPLFQTQDPPMTVYVYYGTPDGALESESRVIFQSAQRINQMKQAVLEALKPPQQMDHLAVVPDGVSLREVYLDARHTAYVDFTGELSSRHSGGSTSEWMTVQAITSTLMKNFEEITNVQLLMDGKSAETLKGHVDLSYPFTVDASLVRPPVMVSAP